MSNIRITKIRTGAGDAGTTRVGDVTLDKSSSEVEFLGALDTAQGYTDALPTDWGDFNPRELAQELLFRAGASLVTSDIAGVDSNSVAVAEIGRLMETQIPFLTDGLEPLKTFIRVGEANAQAQRLRAAVRAAERACMAIRAPDDKLRISLKALNIMSDWVFAFVWLFSLGDEVGVDKRLKWVPFTDEVVRRLNVGGGRDGNSKSARGA